jgi:hypothetical protein
MAANVIWILDISPQKWSLLKKGNSLVKYLTVKLGGRYAQREPVLVIYIPA